MVRLMARRGSADAKVLLGSMVGGGGAGPGGPLPGVWVRTRTDAGAKQLAEERRQDQRRRGRGTWRDVGIFAWIVIGLGIAWVVYRILS